MTQASPQIQLHNLSSSDGSASYISPCSLQRIIAGVNYPLEVSYRSKEVPDDTYIEVNLRPHNAVAGVKEHHVEEVVRRVLKSMIRGEETPRTMLQCTLQVMEVENDESLPGGVKGGGQGESYLEMLCGGLNAAILGCLDAGVQMRTVAGAVLVAVSKSRETNIWPSLKERKVAKSLHVFAYGRNAEMLLCESEGEFIMDEWEWAAMLAKRAVLGTDDAGQDGDVEMAGEDDGRCLMSEIRDAVQARVVRDGMGRDQ